MKLRKKPRPLLLLYGIDAQTLPVDAEVTRDMIQTAERALCSLGWQVATSEVTDNLEAALAPFESRDWLVFNLCEGSPAQPFYYARVAGELERGGYVYTGSDAAALHDNQFKPLMKRRLEAHGLPTPGWTVAERIEDLCFDRFPAIVKPAGEHCSFGITRESVVFTLADAHRQAAAVRQRYSGEVLVEEFLDSEEYGIALWGASDALEILGISVIRYDALPDMRDRLCTFEAKWMPETDAYQKTMPECPARIGRELKVELEGLARGAHAASGARDYSRVDIRMQDGRPMVLEVNANCAVSENSGFPQTALKAGWDYPSMLDRLALMAARRAGHYSESPLSGSFG